MKRVLWLFGLFVLVSGQGQGRRPPPPGQRGPQNPAQDGGVAQKKYVMSANGFNVEINGNGNVPFFVYYADGKEDSKQLVKMEKIWQTDNVNSPGDSTSKRLKKINLVGMYEWAFSNATTSTNTATSETIFTMTGTPRSPGDANNPKPNLVFTNHLLSSANGTELKFDIDITGYADDWWDASATGLVLAYKIETLDSSANPKNASLSGVKRVPNVKRPSRPTSASGTPPPRADAIDLGNGYGFESAGTATSGSRQINATASVGLDAGMPYILVAYAKFSQTLRHDPTLYTADTSSAPDVSASTTYNYDASGNVVSTTTGTTTTTTSTGTSTTTTGATTSTGGNNSSARGLRALPVQIVALLATVVVALVAA